MKTPFSSPQDQLTLRSHIPELDGIRGIAVLAVIVHHCVALYQPQNLTEKILSRATGIGWSGVDLFFVLSGFLISGILIDTRASPTYLGAFYARRVLRIFPLYFGYLIGFFFVVKPAASFFPFPEVAKWTLLPATEQLWYWSYLSNWRSGFGHDVSFLTHLWSLAIEEQFYLIWPFVVLLTHRRTLLRTCVGIVVLAPILRTLVEFGVPDAPIELIYRVTPFRIDALALGAIAAAISRSRELRELVFSKLDRALLGFGVVFLALILYTTNAYHPLMRTAGYSILGLTYATILLSCIARMGTSSLRCRICRSSVLGSFGKYSYGMYVLHYPIAWYCDRTVVPALSRIFGNGIHTVYLGAGITVSATFVVALVSWHSFEKHFLKLKERFRYAAAPTPSQDRAA